MTEAKIEFRWAIMRTPQKEFLSANGWSTWSNDVSHAALFKDKPELTSDNQVAVRCARRWTPTAELLDLT